MTNDMAEFDPLEVPGIAGSCMEDALSSTEAFYDPRKQESSLFHRACTVAGAAVYPQGAAVE
jgi:hypothetical protein